MKLRENILKIRSGPGFYDWEYLEIFKAKYPKVISQSVKYGHTEAQVQPTVWTDTPKISESGYDWIKNDIVRENAPNLSVIIPSIANSAFTPLPGTVTSINGTKVNAYGDINIQPSQCLKFHNASLSKTIHIPGHPDHVKVLMFSIPQNCGLSFINVSQNILENTIIEFTIRHKSGVVLAFKLIKRSSTLTIDTSDPDIESIGIYGITQEFSGVTSEMTVSVQSQKEMVLS